MPLVTRIQILLGTALSAFHFGTEMMFFFLCTHFVIANIGVTSRGITNKLRLHHQYAAK